VLYQVWQELKFSMSNSGKAFDKLFSQNTPLCTRLILGLISLSRDKLVILGQYGYTILTLCFSHPFHKCALTHTHTHTHTQTHGPICK